MFLESFKSTSLAMAQIVFLGAVGYLLTKKNIIGEAGLDILSRLVVNLTLPALIFCQLVKDFSFQLYPRWWLFPLVSFAITIAGLILGYLFSNALKDKEHKLQLVSLIAFQNSGYLPLALIVSLLAPDKQGTMLTYLFLFLLGFNLILWALADYMLSYHESKRFEPGNIFSPPVIAILTSLVLVFFGVNKFIPQVVFKPMLMIGDCTLPLAMFVVGGSLALIKLEHIDRKAMFLVVAAKLIILPALGLWLVVGFKITALMGLLIVMQLAVPPATSLSVIARHYKHEDLLISQGIFVGHMVGLVTLPLFLSLYFTFCMVK